jgi:hypothetical protein
MDEMHFPGVWRQPSGKRVAGGLYLSEIHPLRAAAVDPETGRELRPVSFVHTDEEVRRPRWARDSGCPGVSTSPVT